MNNYYLSTGEICTEDESSSFIQVTGTGEWESDIASGSIIYTTPDNTKKSNKSKIGIHPKLLFKYIKSKFNMLENMSMKRRLDKLEAACYKALENGQEALSKKFLREIARETRESALYAKGIKYFIERDEIMKHKHKIRDGHISDTKFKEYTKIIPKDVLDKKKKYEGFFDDYVIFHYYNSEIEKKIDKSQKRSADEIAKMKDPILFGIIKESNRLYFIADWEDEFCDFTFDEIVDVLGGSEFVPKLTRYPKINL